VEKMILQTNGSLTSLLRDIHQNSLRMWQYVDKWIGMEMEAKRERETRQLTSG
jgi:hypothetical protein